MTVVDEHNRWYDGRRFAHSASKLARRRTAATAALAPLAAYLSNVEPAPAGPVDAWQLTHTAVYTPAGRAHEQFRRPRRHRLVRLVEAPPESGLPAVYITGCGESLLVHESVRTARPVTCRKPGCMTADAGPCSL